MRALRTSVGLVFVLLVLALPHGASASSVEATVSVANALPRIEAAGQGSGLLWVRGADANGGDDLVAARFLLPDGAIVEGKPRAAQGETRWFEAMVRPAPEGDVKVVLEDFVGGLAEAVIPGEAAGPAAPPATGVPPPALQAYGAEMPKVVPGDAVLGAAAAAGLAAVGLRRRGA